MYSEKVMDHFKNPRNVGEIEDADGIGEVGNPVCGDMMTFYIKVKNDRLEDIKFQTFGCGAAIAVTSMVSEMAKGKTLDEALKIDRDAVAEALDGLPKNKMHCSNLGADALHIAIENYRRKLKGLPPLVWKDEDEGEHEREYEHVTREGICYCPFCDAENPEDSPLCTSCGKRIEETGKG
jgi:nitrogen fixation NifU-like protein